MFLCFSAWRQFSFVWAGFGFGLLGYIGFFLFGGNCIQKWLVVVSE